jgi:hypothetical protein
MTAADTATPPGAPIIIAVTPAREPDGRKAYATRGQLFDGTVDGRVIITRSAQPLLDGCRVLLAEGIDPRMRVVMRHQGADHDALISTVGAAARQTVADDSVGKPVFRQWSPSPFGTRPAVPVSPRNGVLPPVATVAHPAEQARSEPPVPPVSTRN